MFDVCARSCLLVHAGLFGEKPWHGRNNLVLFRMADKLLAQTISAAYGNNYFGYVPNKTDIITSNLDEERKGPGSPWEITCARKTAQEHCWD